MPSAVPLDRAARVREAVRADWQARRLRWAIGVLGVVVLARLASLALYPLTDATEARYANIARVMLESGDWITPQTAPGVAFWGKPPLYAWASAASMRVFGLNEFGARLPSLLFGALTLLIVYAWARGVAARAGNDRPNESGAIAAIVLATCVGFFISSGAVMTDAALVFATTWALASFWMAAIGADARRRWRLGFFAALGLGMLAKGPVAVVLVATTIVVWCLVHRSRIALRSFPWLSGIPLALAIAMPWYIVAELKTPGFLRYFIVGENFERFLVPGWKGDLYGFTHAAPHGIVWLYFVAATLPWSLIVIPAAVSRLRARMAALADPGSSFVAFAILAPLGFLSFSAHLIWTHALPAIPPLAVLVGVWLTGSGRRAWVPRYAPIVASAISVALSGCLIGASPWLASEYSTVEICRAWRTAQTDVEGPLIFEQDRLPPSLQFYSDGSALSRTQEEDESLPHYDVYTTEQAARLKSRPECEMARQIVAKTHEYVLVREVGIPNDCASD